MKKLFGTDGIRGIAGKYPLANDFIKKIGYVAATFLRSAEKKEFVIGRDTRESSPALLESISEGIVSAGMDVFDCGIISTPAIAYITVERGSSAGCVISASHNSAEFNGIKFFSDLGIKIADSIESKIEKELENDFNIPDKKKGKVFNEEDYAKDIYTKFLYSTIKEVTDFSGLKIVLDCANGSNFRTAPEVFLKLKADVITISVKPDGKNINRKCGALHIQNLKEAVLKEKANFGIAYDGDGDRCIFIDDKGEIRDGDYIIAIAAGFLKKNNILKNNSVVTTVMANFGFYKAMENKGIKVFSSAVGDKYVYEEMVNNDVILGGEQSGHIIFRDFLNTGDGLLTSLQVASIIKKSGKNLSELSKIIKKYPQVLLNVKVERKLPISENEKLANAIKSVEKKLKDNGRVLVRYSGTESLLRIMVEGPDDKLINDYSQEIAGVVDF
ncbi:MAG: phosphoglucosamine mutase [Elusimicrobia bacterium RIFOXYC2_FULL_34_12]|nr:MAG: phosphoglucosamine mutase [Elusimicrobia bacterium RIFOXYC2_FULL_34_12]